MVQGHCAQCRRPMEVRRYRIHHLGLRWLCDRCQGWMTSVGMAIDLVPDSDPRQDDRGVEARAGLRIPMRARYAA